MPFRKLNIWIIFLASVIVFRFVFINYFSGEKLSIHNCIYQNNHEQLLLENNFAVSLLNNSPSNCINPNFPSIHITGTGEYNAWIHLVYTDNEKYRTFIDSGSFYPFYSIEQDFYDAPLWRYSYFSKPLSFWEGHAYAINVDYDKMTIKFIGGVSWGFKLDFWSLNPKTILPKTLTENEWENDIKFIQHYLPNFIIIYDDGSIVI